MQGAASWGADEANDLNTTGRAQRYSLAGHYINSGLIIAAGYDRQDNTTDTLSSTTGTSVGKASAGDNTVFEKLAAAYKFGSGTWLGAAAERASYGANAHNGNMTQNDFILAITQDVGKASFKLSWNKLGNLNNAYVGKASDWDATQWVLGSTYNLSKTTQVVAYYTTINNSQYQNTNFGIAPLYATGMGSGSNTGTANTPTAGDATNLSPGNKLSALGIGMKVSF